MPKIIKGSVVFDKDEIQSIFKVNKFFDLLK